MTTMFFFLTPMIYLSGFIFPIENMPQWIQYVTYAIPLRYFLVIVRGIFLKGVGFDVLWPQIAALLACGLVLLDAGHAAVEQAPGVAGRALRHLDGVERQLDRLASGGTASMARSRVVRTAARPRRRGRQRPGWQIGGRRRRRFHHREIDRDVWAPVSASVANDDIVAMGRVYHPAAVLVTKAGTKPIAAALDGWGKDIVAAKKRRPGHGGVPIREPAGRRHDRVRDRNLQVLDHRPGRRRDSALHGTGSPAGETRRQVARRHGTSARVDDRGGVAALPASRRTFPQH